MTTIMDRKAAEFWAGVVWPKDIAMKVDDKFITWQEIHDKRRERQAVRLEDIYLPEPPPYVPCYAWVFHNKWSFPYGGWYCYIITRREQVAVNFRGFRESLAMSLMKEIPLVLPLVDNFYQWMNLFIHDYPRTKVKDPRKAGSVVGWYNDDECIFSKNRVKAIEKATNMKGE